MALAEYFHRSAVAAAQVIAGYDEEAIAERLNETSVALSIEPEAEDRAEGAATLDLAIRLVARLYPRLAIIGPRNPQPWEDLARSINPAIEFADDNATDGLVIGRGAEVAARNTYVGSDNWDCFVSSTSPRPVGTSPSPFGAGAAACFGAANLFRRVFTNPDADEGEAVFSTLDLASGATVDAPDLKPLDGDAVLVGLGAVGNGAVWALGGIAVHGHVHVVDHETLDLGNLQRYALAGRDDVGHLKARLSMRHLPANAATPHAMTWADFVSAHGYQWDRVLVAVDSAKTRREIQAALPRWIANGWTQPGDLGVSVHPWSLDDACLSCLYLPRGMAPNEDELLASAFGLPHEHFGLELRRLLATGQPPPALLLEQIAASLDVPIERLRPFKNRSVRELYVEGVCGGAVISLSRIGQPAQPVHVPLAHQSALAGVLLASRLVAHQADRICEGTRVTRIDVLRPIPPYVTQSAKKDIRGLCICQDEDYRAAWSRKYA